MSGRIQVAGEGGSNVPPPPVPKRGTPKTTVAPDIQSLLESVGLDVSILPIEKHDGNENQFSQESINTRNARNTISEPRNSSSNSDNTLERENGSHGTSLSFSSPTSKSESALARVTDVTVVFKTTKLGVRFKSFAITGDHRIVATHLRKQADHTPKHDDNNKTAVAEDEDEPLDTDEDLEFCCVDSLTSGNGGEMRSMLRLGDILFAINGCTVLGMSFEEVSTFLARSKRPVSLVFKRHRSLAALLKSPDFNKWISAASPNEETQHLSSVTQTRLRFASTNSS